MKGFALRGARAGPIRAHMGPLNFQKYVKLQCMSDQGHYPVLLWSSSESIWHYFLSIFVKGGFPNRLLPFKKHMLNKSSLTPTRAPQGPLKGALLKEVLPDFFLKFSGPGTIVFFDGRTKFFERLHAKPCRII